MAQGSQRPWGHPGSRDSDRLQVSRDPSIFGTIAPVGTTAFSFDGLAAWLKTGTGDFDWTPIGATAVQYPIVTLPGSMAFGPDVIPNVELWVKASSGLAFATPNTPPIVGLWSNLAGQAGRDLVATGNPTYVPNALNGRPGVHYVRNVSWHENTTVNLITADRGARTDIGVYVLDDAQGGYLFTFRTGAGNSFSDAHRLAGPVYYHLAGNGDNYTLSTTPPIAGLGLVTAHSYDGLFADRGASSAVRYRMNGLDLGVNSTGLAVPETAAAGFTIGSAAFDRADGISGMCLEKIVISRNIAAWEMRLFMRYLCDFYGVVDRGLGQIQVMGMGDSLTFGTGDATTIAAGGYRAALWALNPRWQSCGSFYSPPGGAGSFNRCEGRVAFTSGATATGIGGANLFAALNGTQGPDLIFLCIGYNDPTIAPFYTAAQTAANIAEIVRDTYALSPRTKFVVLRCPYLSTLNPSSGVANPTYTAQGPLIQAALAGMPNVLGPVLIPQPISNSLYCADNLHILPAGWNIIINQTIQPGLNNLYAQGLL